MNKNIELSNSSAEKIIKDVAIIGAGPIGLFAVFEAGMLGMNSVVIDNLPYLGGQCSALYPQKPIYDIPAYSKILAEDLISKLMEQCSPFDPHFITSANVNTLDKEEEGFQLNLSNGQTIKTKAVIIAAGCGAFNPNKLPIDNAHEYENITLFYSVLNKNTFIDKTIIIAGGGDSALDWAQELANVAKKIFIVHRRNNFRAMENTLNNIKVLQDSGKIEFVTPYQINKLNGENGILKSVELIDFNNETRIIESEYLLSFFGLKMNLGTILNWNLNLKENHISVDPTNMQTNINGVFAIGDIATYSGKLKLILTGFAEAARACHSAYPYVFPGKHLHFQYSTVLGVPESV